jgi:hypothetical protein
VITAKGSDFTGGKLRVVVTIVKTTPPVVGAA